VEWGKGHPNHHPHRAGEKAFVGGVGRKGHDGLDPDGAERFITDLHRCFLAIRQSEKLVIASINGFALGGGLEWRLLRNLRIASARARSACPSPVESLGHRKLLTFPIDRLGRAAEMYMLGK